MKSNFSCCEIESEPKTNLKIYFPLFLIFSYLVALIGLLHYRDGLDIMQAMRYFMAGFFFVFSFFKFLDLNAFAKAYRTYDVVAKKFRVYGFVYPFLELGLGVLYFLNLMPFTTNLFTLLLMLISSVGVLQSLIKKEKIECACLGTVFKLPMTKVTLLENLLMAGMAIAGLI